MLLKEELLLKLLKLLKLLMLELLEELLDDSSSYSYAPISTIPSGGKILGRPSKSNESAKPTHPELLPISRQGDDGFKW